MALSTRTWTWTALTASAAVLTLAIAHAQQPPPAQQPAPRGATSYTPVDIKEPFATTLQRMKAAQPAVQKRQADLLAERYDLADRAGRGRDHVARQAGAGGRARQAAGRRDLGRSSPACRRDEIRERRPVPRGLPAAAASQPSRRRHAVPQVPHRRDQEAGRARPDALRPRLRPARSSAAGVPAADLPDDAARSRRRLAGQARHDRQLLRAVQRHPQSQAARRPAPAGDAVPAAAVQPDRGPPLRAGRAAASPASTATPTATPTPRRTWSATSARRSSAIASTRRRCAASTSSACSARSAR